MEMSGHLGSLERFWRRSWTVGRDGRTPHFYQTLTCLHTIAKRAASKKVTKKAAPKRAKKAAAKKAPKKKATKAKKGGKKGKK